MKEPEVVIRIAGPVLLARLATLLPRLAEEYPSDALAYMPRKATRYYVETDGDDLVVRRREEY